MSDESRDLGQQLQVLIDAYNRDPTSYRTNSELGLFMAEYRQTTGEAAQFLRRAFEIAPDEPAKRKILDRLHYAYEMAGEYELGYQVTHSLYRAFPGNAEYVERHARKLDNRGQFAEASRLYGQLIRRSTENGEKIRRARNEARATQIMADTNEILYAFGELGLRLDSYVKARFLGLAPDVRAVVDVSRFGERVANQCLLDMWRTQYPEQLHFVTDRAEMIELDRIYGAARLQPTLFKLPDGRARYRGSAQAYVQQRWEDEAREPLLKLPPEIVERGRKWLAGLGIPEEAWFVCLHARDGGFRSERAGTFNQHRNARADRYGPLIAEIARRGGWAIRIGNKSEIPMPPMPGFYDYTEAEEREDWKDMFLLARCRFCLASNSGPIAVAVALGRPVLGIDWFPAGHFFGTRRSLFIHKLLRRKEDGSYLTLAETQAPPLTLAQSPVIYERQGIEVLDNDEQDMLAALAEMFDHIEGRLTLSPEAEARRARYAAASIVDQCGINAMISPHFLERHRFLSGE